MVKMVQNVGNYLGNSFGSEQCGICIDCLNLLISAAVLLFDRVYVVNAERKNISVVRRFGLPPDFAFLAKIGVPVKPKM